MSRLIDADALKEEIRLFSVWIMKWNENSSLCREVLSEAKKSYLDLLKESPTVDAVEVRHGHWILEREPDGKPYCFHCSVCDDDFHHIGIKSATAYCPNCGAKMDGLENGNEH